MFPGELKKIGNGTRVGEGRGDGTDEGAVCGVISRFKAIILLYHFFSSCYQL